MFVLILTVFLSTPGMNGSEGVTSSISAAEFTSEKACQDAGEQWLRSAKKTAPKSFVICAKK